MKTSFIAGLTAGAALGSMAAFMIDNGNKSKKHSQSGIFKSVGSVLDSVIYH